MITLHLLYQVEYYNCMYVTFNLQYLQSAFDASHSRSQIQSISLSLCYNFSYVLPTVSLLL